MKYLKNLTLFFLSFWLIFNFSATRAAESTILGFKPSLGSIVNQADFMTFNIKCPEECRIIKAVAERAHLSQEAINAFPTKRRETISALILLFRDAFFDRRKQFPLHSRATWIGKKLHSIPIPSDLAPDAYKIDIRAMDKKGHVTAGEYYIVVK